jgi:hypothetical protein
MQSKGPNCNLTNNISKELELISLVRVIIIIRDLTEGIQVKGWTLMNPTQTITGEKLSNYVIFSKPFNILGFN